LLYSIGLRRGGTLKRKAESQPRGFAAKKRGGNWK
jgi:hypothetical protein